jgi:hypothetical protein
MSVQPLVFDTRTAAELLGCSERWLKIQLRSGRFPGRKITKRWVLSEEDIAAILEMSAVPRGGADASIAECVEEILDTTPGLNDEQMTRLAELLRLTFGDSEVSAQ